VEGGQTHGLEDLAGVHHRTVDQELRYVTSYLATENRILRNQLKGRARLSDANARRWPTLATNWGSRPCRKWPRSLSPTRFLAGTANWSPRSLTAPSSAKRPSPHDSPGSGGLGGAHSAENHSWAMIALSRPGQPWLHYQ